MNLQFMDLKKLFWYDVYFARYILKRNRWLMIFIFGIFWK